MKRTSSCWCSADTSSLVYFGQTQKALESLKPPVQPASCREQTANNPERGHDLYWTTTNCEDLEMHRAHKLRAAYFSHVNAQYECEGPDLIRLTYIF